MPHVVLDGRIICERGGRYAGKRCDGKSPLPDYSTASSDDSNPATLLCAMPVIPLVFDRLDIADRFPSTIIARVGSRCTDPSGFPMQQKDLVVTVMFYRYGGSQSLRTDGWLFVTTFCPTCHCCFEFAHLHCLRCSRLPCPHTFCCMFDVSEPRNVDNQTCMLPAPFRLVPSASVPPAESTDVVLCTGLPKHVCDKPAWISEPFIIYMSLRKPPILHFQ